MSQRSITEITRPTNMDEVIGMTQNKNIIHYEFEGCKRLNQPLPHIIIIGPSGCGKSTMARIISSLTGGKILEYLGNDLKDEMDIYAISEICLDNDVIYVEEAHGLGKKAQIALLEWLENYKVYLDVGESTPAPKVSFVLATTNVSKLSKPFRERCRILHTTFYSIEDIKEILLRAAKKYGLDLSTDDEALTLLAKSSRGTPRTAVAQRLDMVRKIMAVDNLPFNYDTVKKMLKVKEINDWGLTSSDFNYCKVLYDKSIATSAPVAQKTLAHAMGIDIDSLEPIEQYLMQINAINVTSRGRILTKFGQEIIGIAPKETVTDVDKIIIDVEQLRKLVSQSEIRAGGIKLIAQEMGLPYPECIHKIKTELDKLGYKTRRRWGVIPIDR